MALPKVYSTGTISVANGATAVTGVGTAWSGIVKADDVLRRAGHSVRVASVADNTHMTLAEPWPGTSLVASAYELAITYDGPEFQLRTRELLESLNNTFGLTPNVIVDALADRDAYDDEAEGFIILVADSGDGSAAFYAMGDGGSGDWSSAIPIGGPQGDSVAWLTGSGAPGGGTGEDGDMYLRTSNGDVYGPKAAGVWGSPVANIIGPPGNDGNDGADGADGADGVSFIWRGAYSGVTAYAENDVVENNGSAWIALQSTTGNAPPTLPTTSNANWELFARRGTDGAGTVSGVVAGSGIDVDATDPAQPVVSVEANLQEWNTVDPSPNVVSLVSAADYAAMRTLLGLAIGTNVQAYDADLATIAGLTATTDNFIVAVSSAWASRTPSQVRTTLGLVIGTNVQAYDAELAAIAGLTSAADKGIQFTGSGTAATYDLTSFAKTLLDDASAPAGRTTLGASAVVEISGWSPPASNYATWDTRNSHPVLNFDTSTQEAIFVYGTIPANYGNTGLTVAIPVMAASATSGTHAVDAAFENLDAQDKDSDGFATAKASTATTVSGTSGVDILHTIAFSHSEIDGLVAGSRFRLRIRRDVANDNAAGDMQIVPGAVKLEMV
jgi:hypothetical protein